MSILDVVLRKSYVEMPKTLVLGKYGFNQHFKQVRCSRDFCWTLQITRDAFMAWFLSLHFRYGRLYSSSEPNRGSYPIALYESVCCDGGKSCLLPNNEEQSEGVCMPKLQTKVILFATAKEQVGSKEQFIFEPKRLRIGAGCFCGSNSDKYYHDYERKYRVVPERTTTTLTTTTTAATTASSGHAAVSALASPILLVPLFLLYARIFLSSFKQRWFKEWENIAEFLPMSACHSVNTNYYCMIYCFNLSVNIFLSLSLLFLLSLWLLLQLLLLLICTRKTLSHLSNSTGLGSERNVYS